MALNPAFTDDYIDSLTSDGVQRLALKLQLAGALAVQANAANLKRQADAAEAMLAAFKQQATAFDASERGEVMRAAFTALLPAYVKPSTATTPEGKLADARGDAEFLRIAVGEVMGAYDALRGTAGA